MNAIRTTALLNKRELENAVPPSASWHADYRDTAYVYIGGLPPELSEGDIVTIFSQFGNPTHLNLIRDKETGKSKGFAFLKYEDQRSCDLAVDNLGGSGCGGILGDGRLLRVDHTRYKKKDDEDENTHRIDRLEGDAANSSAKRASDTDDSDAERRKRRRKDRPMLKEERELQEMLAIQDGDEEDPMRDYLLKEKREEVERAKQRERKHKHRPHHRHRDENDDEQRPRRRHRSRSGDGEERNRLRDRSSDMQRVKSDRHGSKDDQERQRRRDHGDSRDGDRAHRHRLKEEERESRDGQARPRRRDSRDGDRPHRSRINEGEVGYRSRQDQSGQA